LHNVKNPATQHSTNLKCENEIFVTLTITCSAANFHRLRHLMLWSALCP